LVQSQCGSRYLPRNQMKSSLLYQDRSVSVVREMFASISQSYDFANLILSGGMHLIWNRCLAREAATKGTRYFLDICSGTGAIPKAICRVSRSHAMITMVDICPEMLRIAVRSTKSAQLSASFVAGDAQSMPMLPNDCYDVATMAYGIRNIPDAQLALNEALRTLKPGGRICILELTRPRSAILRGLHKIFVKSAIPALGALISGKPQAYKYLAQSIASFIDPEELSSMMQAAGFRNIAVRPLCGGIATIFTGCKE